MLFGNQCISCKHHHKVPEGYVIELTMSDVGKPSKNYCMAYPDGIPVEIWEDEVDHRYPYKGDGGVTFVAINEGLDEMQKDKFLRYPVKRVYIEEEETESS
jgi:hypothetical protein